MAARTTYWTTKENNIKHKQHLHLPFRRKTWSEMTPNRDPDFFLTTQNLANILGRTDFHYDKFHLLDFWDSRFPDSQISRRCRHRHWTNSQIPTWSLSQRTQRSDTLQGALAAAKRINNHHVMLCVGHDSSNRACTDGVLTVSSKFLESPKFYGRECCPETAEIRRLVPSQP